MDDEDGDGRTTTGGLPDEEGAREGARLSLEANWITLFYSRINFL